MRSSLVRLLFAAAAFASLAACQPVPQPFSHGAQPPDALTDTPGPRGIVVLPVAEAPPKAATGLAQAVVAKLIEAGIPAFVGRGNRSSLFLLGHVVDDGRDARIVWTLQEPDGREIETFPQPIEAVPGAPWTAGNPALMERLAAAAVPAVVALVEPPPAQPLDVPPVHVGPVAGVSDAVAERMRSAVRQALVGLGAETSDAPGSGTLVARGEVRIAGTAGGVQKVDIAWSLYDPNEIEIGTIRQARTLPPVEGPRDWSPMVREAGTATAAGLYELINAIDWSGGFAGTAENPAPAR